MYLYFPPSHLSLPNFAGYFNNQGGGTRRCDVKGNACKVALMLSSLEELSFVALSWSCETVITAQQTKPSLPLQLYTANGIYFINGKVWGKENLSFSVTYVPKQMALF